MNTNFEKIKELISKSSLSLSEQIDLVTIFVKTKDEDLEVLADLFSHDPTWISKINDNYQAKNAALATKNPSLWKKIIEEEQSELEKIEG
jgi:hypothetical protein